MFLFSPVRIDEMHPGVDLGFGLAGVHWLKVARPKLYRSSFRRVEKNI